MDTLESLELLSFQIPQLPQWFNLSCSNAFIKFFFAPFFDLCALEGFVVDAVIAR